jgi:hypothetical protein
MPLSGRVDLLKRRHRDIDDRTGLVTADVRALTAIAIENRVRPLRRDGPIALPAKERPRATGDGREAIPASRRTNGPIALHPIGPDYDVDWRKPWDRLQRRANGRQAPPAHRTLACAEVQSYGAGVRLMAAMPAATLRPVLPSMLTGCNAIELPDPPTSALAPRPAPTVALPVAPA